MTDSQFNQWWHDYQTRFPRIADWLAKSPDKPATLATWRDVLRDAELTDCMEINRRMSSGIVSPIGEFSEHRTAQVIATEARIISGNRRLQETEHAGLDIDDCDLCGGSGFVRVWHGALVACLKHRVDEVHVREHGVQKIYRMIDDGKPKPNTAVVRCSCAAAARYEKSFPQSYNEDDYCRVVSDGPQADVDAWLARKPKMFGAYSGN
jgi:hypothetical protein